MSVPASGTRLSRLVALQQATQTYVQQEQTRILNEVSVLQAVLSGRTGGAGIQSAVWQQASKATLSDLADYLNGA